MPTKKRYVELMLDSGAYSAWTMARPIQVKDYISFVREYRELIWETICLDVLPGTFGAARTRSDVEKAAKASYENLQKMKAAGLHPIPVYHRGEPYEWLERLLKDGEPYIGLSPLVDSKEKAKREWLDMIFSRYLCDGKGNALVKTHGFGVTNPVLMMRYPWYSVDSTAWVKSGGFGIVYAPILEKGVPNYQRIPARVHISAIATKKGSNSLASMGPTVRQSVLNFLESEGFDAGQLLHSRTRRCAACLAFFNKLQLHLPLPFKHASRGFLQRESFRFEPPKWALKNRPFYLVHSTDLSNNQAYLLNEAKIHHRLLSYFELREAPRRKIEQYVKDGMDLDYIIKQPPAKWQGNTYKSYRRMKLRDKMEEGHRGSFETTGAD